MGTADEATTSDEPALWCHLHRRVACACHAPKSPMRTGDDCGARCMGRGLPCVLYRGHHDAHVDAAHATWAQSREERGVPPHPAVAALSTDALRTERDQLRALVSELKAENAALRRQLEERGR